MLRPTVNHFSKLDSITRYKFFGAYCTSFNYMNKLYRVWIVPNCKISANILHKSCAWHMESSMRLCKTMIFLIADGIPIYDKFFAFITVL